MKYMLYHPLTTTWLFPDQTHSRTHKITKSSLTDSRRLAEIHHRQTVHQRNPEMGYKLASPDGTGLHH